MSRRTSGPRGSWVRVAVALAVGAVLVLSPVGSGTAGATALTPTAAAPPAPPAPDVPAAPKVTDRDEPGRAPNVLPSERFLRASDVAREDAMVDLEGSSEAVQARCAGSAGVSMCIRRRSAVEQVPVVPHSDGAMTSEPFGSATSEASRSAGDAAAHVSAAVSAETLGHSSKVCDGTGSDGFRVQPVYAYEGVAPNPVAVQAISDALSNVDQAFSASAARTGGFRDVRWITDSGAPGCRVVLRTARITTGSTDFGALMTDLELQGAVPAVGVGTTKHLVWTEGEIFQPSVPGGPRPGTCGLGESYDDERPLGSAQQNNNLYGTRAAIDDRCWDLNGGGSIPAHELMHTFGAVQQGAPNYANDGHCNDEYDLMCYGLDMRYPCSALTDNALFDCGNDDYFNTDPDVGQYLCEHWNTSDSAYLQGWNVAQRPRAVLGLTATASPGRIHVGHSGTASCYGADYYRVKIAGVRTVDTTSRSVSVEAPVGSYTVTVTPHSPYGDIFGVPISVTVTVPKPKPVTNPKPPPRPNRAPVGAMVLSLTDGRGYGMLAWAIDPDTGGPTRMRVVIPGVVNREYNWNYSWADMPARTGWNRRESLVLLARLPPGTHRVCFDAKDANTGGWYRLECRTHSVK